MADFCLECSINTFGKDFKDLANITSQKDWDKGLAQVVFCEGCGVIQVDPDGNCVSSDCMESAQSKSRRYFVDTHHVMLSIYKQNNHPWIHQTKGEKK